MPIPVAKGSARKNLVIENKFPDADCQNCPLAKAKCTVPDVIQPEEGFAERPAVVYIGEGPASEEARIGKPFQGDSGKILREAIKDRGLEKYGAVFHNAVACDTRGLKFNEDDKPEFKKLQQEKWKQAIASCYNHFWNVIEEADPELIVVLGNFAKQAVLPEVKDGIMKLAGTYYKDKRGWEFLFSYHPAFILHAQQGDRFISEFLVNLNEARLYFEAQDLEANVHIAKNVSDVRKYLKLLDGSDYITTDVETTSFNPWDTGWSVNPVSTPEQEAMAIANGYTLQGNKLYNFGKLLSVQLCGDGKNAYVIPATVAVQCRELIGDFLKRHDLLAHNGSFDIPWLREYFDDGKSWDSEIKCARDTMFVAYSMEESAFHSLKRHSREILGVEDWSETIKPFLGKRATSFANIPPELRDHYAGLDVVTAHQLWKPLRSAQTSDDARIYDEWLLPVSQMTTNMMHRGTGISLKGLNTARKFVAGEKKRIGEYLWDEYRLKNPNAAQQVKDILLNDGDDGGFALELPDTTTTGKGLLEGLRLSEDADAEDWEHDLSNFAKAVLDYRTAYKAENTYIKDVINNMGWGDFTLTGDDAIGFVHPDTKLWATVTGRVVISNPTLTNYPKGTRFSEAIRNYFVPRPGNSWLHVDFKNFELRIFAAMMGDEILRDIFLNPDENGKQRDPHREAGLQIYGDEFDTLNHNAFGMLRVIVKQCVFGRLYNRGPNAIAEQLEIDIEESERICGFIDNFFGKLSEYREMVTDRVLTDQRLVNPLGRSRRFPLITRTNMVRIMNMAMNYLIQSTASDLNLISVLQVTKEFPDVYPLFTIHDSVEFEVPTDKADEYVPRIIEILEQFPASYFPGSDIPMQVDYTLLNFWQADDKEVMEVPQLG